MIIIFIGLYYLTLDDWYKLIIIVTVGYFLTCVLIDLILRPRLTAKFEKIRPMLMFIRLFGDAAVIGILGLVLGPVLPVRDMTEHEILLQRNAHGEKGD